MVLFIMPMCLTLARLSESPTVAVLNGDKYFNYWEVHLLWQLQKNAKMN